MNKILSNIQEIIHQSCEIQGDDKKQLKELNENMIVSIKANGQYLLYDFEKIKGGNLFPFFLKSENLSKVHSIADYVLFSTKKDTLFIIIFELKKGRKDPKPQLNATSIFVNFIIESVCRVKKVTVKREIRKIGITKNFKQSIKPTKFYDKNNFAFYSGDKINLDILLQ